MNTHIQVTVAVKPRARFSCTQLNLESLQSNTEMPFKLLYLDGNSPPHVRNWLDNNLPKFENATLLRLNHYLGPFHSYNIILSNVDTKYVAIVDNDIFFQPKWLERLYKCAEEEQADVVMPLVTIGEPDSDIIHVAGGNLQIIKNEKGQNVWLREQKWEDYKINDIQHKLKREPTELLELHCLLIRTDFLKSLQKFDESFGQITETNLLSWICQEAGAKMIFEPTARVTFLWGNRVGLSWSDLPFWNLTWSEQLCRQQLQWQSFVFDIEELHVSNRQIFGWLGYHRRIYLMSFLKANKAFFERFHLQLIALLINKSICLAEVAFNYLYVAWLRQQECAKFLCQRPSYKVRKIYELQSEISQIN